MYSATIPDVGQAPASVDVALDLVANGLDARFVDAGAALARAYDIVEKVIAGLGGMTDALDREAATRAVANMQRTAERLERLPATMAARSDALATVEKAGKNVQDHIFRVGRTLEFLRICGLNIKVAAAGQNGFSEFADAIFVKLDVSESEIAAIGRELRHLVSLIPSVLTVDRTLAVECAVVVPNVPRRLAEDALGLQKHLDGVTTLSETIAAVARRIRGKLGDALGALQIGDITRQRLEHVATGYRMLLTVSGADREGDALDEVAEKHVLALLSAQTSDAIADFRLENQRLVDSLREIVPDVVDMLALHGDGGANTNGDAAFLETLEQRVAEVGKVTTGLRDADVRSHMLGQETAATVERLGQRLKIIHQVTNEVHNMAWNTDLRCYRIGRDGNGLARIAAEIRSFVGTLESISAQVAADVGRLETASRAIGRSQSDSGEEETLEQSLATIQNGARRMRENLSDFKDGAALVATILDEAVNAVDCETTFAASLDEIGERFQMIAQPQPEIEAELSEPAQALLNQIANLYTMAKERSVHHRFAPNSETIMTGGNPGSDDDDDEDDGLF
ncbi:hypothetical protein AB5I39_08490 [Sphingomonas sp. MMS24-J45]|uniref:hypothetical protein n=1 Tax=Sphingomonas sp. MMS24-J45 TaxID=3238806 RepID=UPI00384F774E